MTTIIKTVKSVADTVLAGVIVILASAGAFVAFALFWVVIACVLSGIVHLIAAGHPITD